jgi:hypothetical protein
VRFSRSDLFVGNFFIQEYVNAIERSAHTLSTRSCETAETAFLLTEQ